MGIFRNKFKNTLIFLFSRIHILIFSISILSLVFIFFKILNVNLYLGISEIWFLELIFNILVILSTLYTILFLPTYPVFFIIFKEKSFNFLEKLSLTIVMNSVFYILMGYMGYLIRIPLTRFFFFFSVVILFFLIIGYTIIFEFKKNPTDFFRFKDISTLRNKKLSIVSWFNYLKNMISFNSVLLIVFLFLICILNIIKVKNFVGTDPWLHILNSTIITDYNILPLEGYHGVMGLNIFEAVIYFFSGIEHILIPKYFVFYTFFVSGLIFYNICMRIFKNKNLALFGVFLLEFSSLGFSTMMIQYWPSGSALIKCLMIFFLLYVRLQNFTKSDRPTKKVIFSNIYFDYLIITLIFISSVLTHDVTTLFFLISFLWLYLIYFLRDYRRGFDFIFICILLVIFLGFSFFGIGEGHYWFLSPLNLSWYYLVSGILGGGLILFIILRKLLKSINFTDGKFNATIKGEINIHYKKIEDKIIIPLISSGVFLSLIVLLIMSQTWMNIELINILYVIEIILISSFAIWGLIVFQKKQKGKSLFIWGVGLFLLLLVGFMFNFLVLDNMIWQRILYLIPPIIVFGFLAYVYKLIKLNSFRTFQKKFLILFIILFSLLTTYFYELKSFEVFTLKEREISCIQWYSNKTSNKNVIITEVGWSNVFIYFNYFYGNNTKPLPYDQNFYFLKSEIDLFPPSNHYNQSGLNILEEIKSKYNTDVFILFADDYIINKGFDLFGSLSGEDREEYYSLNYLNRICISSTEDGREIPLFWVI